jgi:DNA-binding NtrC family response regulator
MDPHALRLDGPEGEPELCGMVGPSEQMRRVFALVRRSAPLDVPIIVGGETGTGKELVARAVHALSARSAGPFVVLDCGAIPPSLIESELFGHEKGAFTGAHAARPGAFERAHGGTIFLDELGELRLDLQPKLLRVLENREVRRLGASDVLHVDCRVVAATHCDLARMVAEGRFRQDLYFRLNVLSLELPPLRQRREDIPFILARALAQPGGPGRPRTFSPRALALLQAYPWPGNVRELLNVLGHVLAFCDGDEVRPEHLPPRISGELAFGPVAFDAHLSFRDAKAGLLESFEREYLARLLRRCEGNLSRAARESGLHRKSIERLVKKHALDAKGMKPR